jgi:CBS-domain-containing membrane protein
MILSVLQLFSGNFVGAVWWFLIGMFLRSASQMSYRQVVVRAALEGEPVRRLMTPDPVTVPPDITIRELVDDYIYRHHHKMFPVVGDSQRLLGCVGASQIRTIPREEWSQRHVEDVVQPCAAENTVTPDTDALKLLSLMSRTGTSRVMVVEQGRLLAVVTLRDLLQFISSKLNLGDYASGDGRPLDFPADAIEEERQVLLPGR